MLLPLVTFAALAGAAPATEARFCSIAELRQSPGYSWRFERIQEMVDSASRIVLARAVAVDSAARTVSFRPIEWIRGSAGPANLVLVGAAVDRDDFNPGSVPYRMVRSAGQRGDCFAAEYRTGADYLLLLRDHGTWSPIQWWPLAPVNEQVRGADDPWVDWVRQRAARRASSRGDT